MDSINDAKTSDGKNKFNLALDLRMVSLVLLAVIAAMLVIWKPWSSPTTSGRTITVTGETKLSAKPDEFVFYPSYEFKNASKDAALAELTKKSDELVSKLKSLGVKDEKIKTNSSGYDYSVYYDSKTQQSTYTLQLTVTVNDFTLAQKVQDYLVTTSPSGAVSPQADFSESKRKELENNARDGATKDARRRAEQMAKNLGFKLGKVKSVSDGTGFGGISLGLNSAVADTQPQLKLQPGENDLDYSLTVVYFIR
ncbi:MAG TPA: SIMPL domain-containing protein [Candidatus Saccharimonadales bacterium]|nr:SIMPL domain-containing protein [Candidatus Saccharimonadales bacterium]